MISKPWTDQVLIIRVIPMGARIATVIRISAGASNRKPRQPSCRCKKRVMDLGRARARPETFVAVMGFLPFLFVGKRGLEAELDLLPGVRHALFPFRRLRHAQMTGVDDRHWVT